MHACKKLVENVIFFRNLPLNLLVRIISCLRIEVFLVNDVIIRANTPGASMYFISTGTVAIYTKSGKEVSLQYFKNISSFLYYFSSFFFLYFFAFVGLSFRRRGSFWRNSPFN